MPLRFCRRIGTLLGGILWWVNGRARRTTETNIALCYPAMPEADQALLVKRSLQETAKTTVEMGPAWYWQAETVLKVITKIHGADILAEAAASKQGVILLAPHIGNWEFLGLYLGKYYQTTILYQPPKSEVLGNLIYRSRRRNGVKLAATDRKGVMQLLKTLRAGNMIGILPDQEPDPNSGLFAPFFGVPALTMTLVSNLVAKTGAQLVCGMALRNEQSKGFELIFFKADESIAAADLNESVAALNRSVESCVQCAPEQYQWEYKRFKRRPNNLPRFYAKK